MSKLLDSITGIMASTDKSDTIECLIYDYNIATGELKIAND